jgi:prephenate dehydrogenase
MIDFSGKKVLIAGLGQIGGSIGLDLVKCRIFSEVIGYDRNQIVVDKAVGKRAIDRTVDNLGDGIEQADIIILAVSIRIIIKLIPTIAKKAGESKIILDVAGTKQEIFDVLSEQKMRINYIGGHPIAGTEKVGIDGARQGLFKNAAFVLTPSKGSTTEALVVAKAIVSELNARALIMAPEEHDHLIALTSNLPYALSVGLMNLAVKKGNQNRKLWKIIGGSFRSATRVSQSSPELTLDMFMTNRPAITGMIDGMIGELSELKRMIKEDDETALRVLIKKARKKSEAIHFGQKN